MAVACELCGKETTERTRVSVEGQIRKAYGVREDNWRFLWENRELTVYGILRTLKRRSDLL